MDADLWVPAQHDQHCPAREGGACIEAEGCKPAPETPSLHTGDEALSTQGDAQPVEGEKRKSGLLKSGVSASEAGKLRWAKERARQANEAEEAAALSTGKIILLRTPIHVGDIIARLHTKAKGGDVQAARELREWMSRYPTDDETDISALDARTQAAVLTRVLADIIEDEGSAPDAPEGGPPGVG